ncbi:hypothetical protein BDV93DRAFT_608884 [Ceratobasidium sp. AG-I]|nr:hypothetical protein BDV93DRAFT_608884 [Ceratobasidium sp. AG-I]
MLTFIAATIGLALSANAQYTATYDPTNLPPTTEKDQIGTNQCGTKASQGSLCQNVFVNSVHDFCLWAPPYSDGHNSSVGDVEQIMVSWCMNDGYGTRLIPDGTIKGAHFVQTPDYVQVTGWGDFTKMNIPARDAGGELDPHGADGLGNPHGGLVFGNSFGKMQQYHEWTNFMSATNFCIRACRDDGVLPKKQCNHIYDLQGCDWNIPASYTQGVFEDCKGDVGLPMGIYGTSTFRQGHGATPAAHPIPSSSECTSYSTIKNGVATLTANAPTTAATTATGTGATVVPSAGAGASTNAAVGVRWGAMSGVVGVVVCVVGAMLGGIAVL